MVHPVQTFSQAIEVELAFPLRIKSPPQLLHPVILGSLLVFLHDGRSEAICYLCRIIVGADGVGSREAPEQVASVNGVEKA